MPGGREVDPRRPDLYPRVPPRGAAVGDGVYPGPIGGRDNVPGDPELRRTAPPTDPIDTDPIGGRKLDPKRAEPVQRPKPLGFSADDLDHVNGRKPLRRIFPADAGIFSFEPLVQFSVPNPRGVAA